MVERTVAPGRVRVDTTGLLTRRHRLVQEDGLVGELRLDLTTTYTDASGRQVRIERPSPWRRAVELWDGTQVRASARWRPLEARIAIRMDDTLFWLQRVDGPAWSWELVLEDRPLLTIRRTGWDRAEIVVHAPVEGDLLAFSYYLAVIRPIAFPLCSQCALWSKKAR